MNCAECGQPMEPTTSAAEGGASVPSWTCWRCGVSVPRAEAGN
jgi:hypothetical protein